MHSFTLSFAHRCPCFHWVSVLAACALLGTPSLRAQAAAAAAAPEKHGAALAAEFRARRLASREIPAAVKRARPEAQVVAPREANGAKLTITRIAPPALPPEPPVIAARMVSPFTEAQRAAMRAAAPLQTLLLSPSIRVYPGGVSYVQWSWPSAQREYQDYAAWLPWDMSSIRECGDYEVARTRYCMEAYALPASPRELQRTAPSAATLRALPAGYLLVQGDPNNSAAHEPLRALVEIYKKEAPVLATAHAKSQLRHAQWENWEKENPEPIVDTEVRFWPIQSKAYPTKP